MPTLNLAGAFLADILAHPGDSTPLLIYADWLEDRGEDALLWRWMAQEGSHPFHRLYYHTHRTIPAKWGWGWYRYGIEGHRFDPHPAHHARLPKLLFPALGGSYDHVYYPSAELAIEALGNALERLREIVTLCRP